jgi:Deoxynucleoside kinase
MASPPRESSSPALACMTPSNKTGWSSGAQLESLFIGISGLIGAGKTTLCKSLADRLGCPAYYEGVIDNVYLADFYADQAKYSFQLQVFLLNRRFKQHQQIVWGGQGGVQDRTIYEDSVFAKVSTCAHAFAKVETEMQCAETILGGINTPTTYLSTQNLWDALEHTQHTYIYIYIYILMHTHTHEHTHTRTSIHVHKHTNTNFSSPFSHSSFHFFETTQSPQHRHFVTLV